MLDTYERNPKVVYRRETVLVLNVSAVVRWGIRCSPECVSIEYVVEKKNEK